MPSLTINRQRKRALFIWSFNEDKPFYSLVFLKTYGVLLSFALRITSTVEVELTSLLPWAYKERKIICTKLTLAYDKWESLDNASKINVISFCSIIVDRNPTAPEKSIWAPL